MGVFYHCQNIDIIDNIHPIIELSPYLPAPRLNFFRSVRRRWCLPLLSKKHIPQVIKATRLKIESQNIPVPPMKHFQFQEIIF